MSALRAGRRQSGFVLVLAIFMIVSLAAIGVYLVTISTTQVEAGVQDEQGARAYQAARAGIDWAAYQLLQKPAAAYTVACNAGSTSLLLPLTTGGFAGYSALVGCQSTATETEGAATVRSYLITVTGCNQTACPGTAGPTYVERQLQLMLTK